MAEQAAELADTARGIVPTGADSYAQGGEFVEHAARAMHDARELLILAVGLRAAARGLVGGYRERARHLPQSAHERYAEDEKRLGDAMVECWLLGDDPRHTGLPEGAADPAGMAGILDRWVTRQLQPTDLLARKPRATRNAPGR